ncbi:MAG: hypothetical protein EA397_04590 [Deltaproteobacteria bacterium]|nr:MAG: hypothetical protein EA397_04590 [Deltaproteobacteria bacterium]
MTLRSFFAAASLALTLCLPATAQASEPVEGLAWQWNGMERTYHIESSVFLPEFIWIRALNNLEVRCTETHLDFIATCAPLNEHKKKWLVRCKIDDIALQAVAMSRDAAQAQGPDSNLDKILREWKERLTGTTMEIRWRDDGRLGSFKFTELDRRNRRDLENTEIMRQLFMRAFSVAQVRLPRKGTDDGQGAFEEKNPMFSGYPAGVGGVGAVRVQHRIEPHEDSLVYLRTKGAGSIGHPSATSAEITQEVKNTFNMDVSADGIFDLERGHLVSREAEVEGLATSSSAVSEGIEAPPYIQRYTLKLLTEGDERPELRETKAIDTRR